jgi:hypothetical protein
MVQDINTDVSMFTEMLARLPYLRNRTTSVHQCGSASFHQAGKVAGSSGSFPTCYRGCTPR